MFKIYTVDKHLGFKALTVKRHLSGWTFVLATPKICMLIFSNFQTISS